MKEAIVVPDGPSPGGAYSQAIVFGEIVYTAGQTGTEPGTGRVVEGLAAQVELAIDNLERVLAAAGSDLTRVLKTTCFLTDVSQFAVFNEIYAARFPAPLPARSTVEVRLAGTLEFEIEAVAARSVDAP